MGNALKLNVVVQIHFIIRHKNPAVLMTSNYKRDIPIQSVRRNHIQAPFTLQADRKATTRQILGHGKMQLRHGTNCLHLLFIRAVPKTTSRNGHLKTS